MNYLAASFGELNPKVIEYFVYFFASLSGIAGDVYFVVKY